MALPRCTLTLLRDDHGREEEEEEEEGDNPCHCKVGEEKWGRKTGDFEREGIGGVLIVGEETSRVASGGCMAL